MEELTRNFDNIFASQSIIEDSTVYEEKMFDNGRKFVYQYSGRQADLVMKKVNRVIEAMDKMRSPSIGGIQLVGDMYKISLTYYGLD
jgi:hypothetical protein